MRISKSRLHKLENKLSIHTGKEIIFFDNKIGTEYAKRYNLSLDATIEEIEKEGYVIMHFLEGELYYTGIEGFDLQGNPIHDKK